MKEKFVIALFAGLVFVILFFFSVVAPKLFPKLETDAMLNDRLLFQQVVLPSSVDSVQCKPSKRPAKKGTNEAPVILPDGFTCLVKIVGQESEQTFSTFGAEQSEKTWAFETAAAAGLRFSINRSEMDNGRVRALVHVDDKSLVSVDEAAAAIKSVLTALADSPWVKSDAVRGAASEAEASRAWEGKRRANAASWTRP